MANDYDAHATVTLVEDPYQDMLKELRETHGDEIDTYLRELIRDAIHESYKQLDDESDAHS
jgi:hypothetical protein